MAKKGELLIAIMNDKRDFAIARDQHWYRIPTTSAVKWLKGRWPPEWIAFYQTKVFGTEKYSIRYYAQILDIKEVKRWQLFPNEPPGRKTNRTYFQLLFTPLLVLPKPILSLRGRRRIVFIPTTWEKFIHAGELNDLYDDSPLEDRLWKEFKRHNIKAERQRFVTVKGANYALDFEIECMKGNIDVETDGDSYHANPEKAALDNVRNNALESAGWNVLRFSTVQIQEETETYCVQKVTDTINNLGGLKESELVARKIDLKSEGSHQLSLFD